MVELLLNFSLNLSWLLRVYPGVSKQALTRGEMDLLFFFHSPRDRNASVCVLFSRDENNRALTQAAAVGHPSFSSKNKCHMGPLMATGGLGNGGGKKEKEKWSEEETLEK